MFFAAAFLAVSCVDPLSGPTPEGDGMIPINISGSVNQVQTKANDQGFVDKDALGLYAVNYTDNNAVAGTLMSSGNQADNVKYVFDEPNHKWVPVRPVYYKDIDTHVDLYLYYPYQNSISDVTGANFEVQKDQSASATASSLSGYEASDWLWGKGEDITPSETKVPVRLSHRFSAVQLELVEGSGFDPGEYASLSKNAILTGTTRKAVLDYSNGGVSPWGSAQLDGILMCPQNDGTWRAVVIPQTVSGGTRLFSVTIGGMSYSYSQGDAVVYQQGKQMNVSLTVNKKSPSGEYELKLASSQITDWTEDRNTHGGEARQYFVVNVAQAGTLQATIEAAGKNPAKIRNLKVTGVVNSDDFYFMRDQMTILEAVNMKESRIAEGVAADPGNSPYYYPSEADVIPPASFYKKKSLTYFVFPEHVVEIGNRAFYQSNLAGTLVMPDDIEIIGEYAFANTNISSVQFSNSLKEIKDSAFNQCYSATGPLLLPGGLERIGSRSFAYCNFSGFLHLPSSLGSIGEGFLDTGGSFTGDLIIPERIKVIPNSAFRNTTFSGQLFLSNVIELGPYAFEYSGFTGDLVVPEGILDIPGSCFHGTYFTHISFPSKLRTIGEFAFCGCRCIQGILDLPDGLITVGKYAFSYNDRLTGIVFPSTLQSIHDYSFTDCFDVSSIVCGAVEPPTIGENAFLGISKENFQVEVPEQSIVRYQTDPGWRAFTRIGAHYDFSISRRQVQALNAEYTKTLTLRAPSGFDWSILSKPDWVTVSPSSGTGKTDVTITVSFMPEADERLDYYCYGRTGDIIFLLNGKDYTTTLTVNQYDSDYYDGSVQVLQTHSRGPGIDIVFVGDGYSAYDIASGAFFSNAMEGYGHFFDVEPYKSYKDYFDVYAVTAVSEESGIEAVDTQVDNKFGSAMSTNRLKLAKPDEVFSWALKADAGMDLSKSLVILLVNASIFEGITFMETDGSALSMCPVSRYAYPYDFRGTIQHEAGGHGFGKLGDEYIYHNAFIQRCDCPDGCDHPQAEDDFNSIYGRMKSLGWFRNLTMLTDHNKIPWAHLMFHPNYSDYVDIYEGGYMHSRGIYRSEVTSCMNNNIPYFSAISRQAIVERIKAYAGEPFSLEEFYANDSRAVGPTTKAGFDPTFGVDPNFVRATGQGPILMGDHPNVK